MNKRLEIKYIPLSELKKLPKNPKLHDIGELNNSFDEFGFRDAIKVNRLTKHIEAGNGRLDTLLQKKQQGENPPDFIVQQNGEWLAPVIFFEDDEKTERRFALADNRIGEIGGFDEPLLLENLIDLKDDLFATGYTSEDIDLLNEKLDINESIINYKYEPHLNPEQANRQVTSGDIEKTSKKLENQMIKEQNKRTMICPHCLEEFEIDD